MRRRDRIGEQWRRLLHWLQRERRERELQEEMAAHREQMDDPSRFGSTLRLGDEARDVWGWTWLDQLAQDLRIALRSLGRERTFFATTTAILALAIGANTAIFSVVEAVLLERLPFRDSEALVALWEHAPEGDRPRTPVAPATLAEWRARTRSFASLAAATWRGFELSGEGEPRRLQGQAVSPELFDVLGVTPALGRGFLPGEGAPGHAEVAILSHSLWRSGFGGDAGVVGRKILLDQRSYEVVGVLPADFQLFESYLGIWTPLALTPEEWRDEEPSLRVIGRLRPGVRLAEARAELNAVAEATLRDRGDTRVAGGALVVPLREDLAGESRRGLLFLMAAVGVVLLAACTNVGGLFLTRGLARQRELAVRAALGAGRGRLVRQLVAESLIVALPAAAAGAGLARASLPLLRRLVPPQRVLSASVALDGTALGFTAALAVLAVLLFGLLPALRVARPGSGAALARGHAGGTGRGQALLVVVEVAVALLLVAEAGLLARSLDNLRGQYAGLRPESLLTLRTTLSFERYWSAPRRAAFYEEVLAGVEALPGVRSAGYTTSLPLEWSGGGHELVLEGRTPAPGEVLYANHRQVSARYLQTLGVRLVEGRHFAATDGDGAPLVAIVNRTLARRFWPGEEPLGRRLALAPGRPWRTVVGVVEDVRQMGATEPVSPELYLPLQQVRSHGFLRPRDLVARVEVEPRTLATAARDVVHRVDPLQPVALVRSFEDILDEVSGVRRLQGGMLGAFAALALLLAALGTHAALAHWVTQRRREIGVRLAVGAHPSQVLALVLGRGARLVALGVALGLVACAGAAPLTRHLLFEVSPADARTHLGVLALLGVVALGSCLLPAWRAARLDPARTLRAD